MYRAISLLIAFALMMAGLGGPVQAKDTGEEPLFEVDALYDAVYAGEIDAALDYLTDDAVLVILPAPEGEADAAFVGKEEIRTWYEGLHADKGRAEYSNLRVDGDRVTWEADWYSDMFESLGVAPAEFEGTAIIQDGKIKSMIWSWTKEFEEKFNAAMALKAQEDLISLWLSHWDTVTGKLDDVEDILTEDFVSHNMPEGGREAMIADIAGFRVEHPNTYFSADRPIIQDGKAYVTVRMWQIPEGAEEGTKGEPASPPYLLILGIEDGKISEHWMYTLLEESASDEPQ